MFVVLCAVSGLTMRNNVYMDIVLIIVSLVFVVITFFAEGFSGFVGFFLSLLVFGFSLGLFCSRWIRPGKVKEKRIPRP